jgi:catechol 2,3-dioxygenase-like lactoylglutathione lyase family enzyme
MMNRRTGLTLCLGLCLCLRATVAGAADPVTSATDYDNVHIRVLDPLKAAAWYVEALGATPSNPPAPGTSQVTFGSNVITITKGESTQPSTGHLRVKDPAATLSWYAQHFGGERTRLKGQLDGVRFNGVWLFAMSSGTEMPSPAAAIMLVALRVDDVDTAMKALSGSGAKVLGEVRNLPALRYAFVEDPNGIRVEVVTRIIKP